MSPSYFSVQTTEPPARCPGEGPALPLLQLPVGAPRRWESGLGILSLPEDGAPLPILSPAQEEPEGHCGREGLLTGSQ